MAEDGGVVLGFVFDSLCFVVEVCVWGSSELSLHAVSIKGGIAIMLRSFLRMFMLLFLLSWLVAFCFACTYDSNGTFAAKPPNYQTSPIRGQGRFRPGAIALRAASGSMLY